MREGAGIRRRRRTLLLMSRSTTDSIPVARPFSSSRPELILQTEDNSDFLIVEDSSGRIVGTCPLDRPCIRIGRSPRSDLCLNHASLEPQHTAIFILDGALYVCSLSPAADIIGSRGGVIADWWRPGENLWIGPYRLRIDGAIDQPPPEDPRACAKEFDTELSRPVIHFRGGDRQLQTCPLTRHLTLIGSSELCDWRLDVAGILPVHAAIVRNSAGLSLIDLSDEGRTLVNEQPAAFAPLDVGDTVRLGNVSGQVQSSATWEPALLARPDSAVAAPSATEADRLVRELKAQHLRMLEFHRSAVEQIDKLMADPAKKDEPLNAILVQIEKSRQVLNRELEH